MNILVWATTFGADLWSFTKYLSKKDGVTVKVLMDDPETFKRQGVAQLFPLDVEMVRRRYVNQLVGVPFFRPDVTILDNWTPMRRTSPKAFMLWHGFGWRGPNDEKELRTLHMALKTHWGDVRVPNPNFRWQCFGPWDLDHRSKISRIHRDNCRLIGAASHDDLTKPLDRSLAQQFYPFDILGKKTVLIAPTWHYGDIFDHWPADDDVMERLIRWIFERGANAILRLHDSFRYDKKYLTRLQKMASAYPNVMLKFKDKDPDNYLDLQVSDVLISNFSSIANLFYATGRPSIQVYPVNSADEEHVWRQYTIAGVRKKRVDKAHLVWKLPLEDNGGLVATEFDELVSQLDMALDDPSCCAVQARDFLDRHMMGADGRACERAWKELSLLVNDGKQ